MTVSQIVNDLLEHKMITTEAALVLLKAEAESIAYRNMEYSPAKTLPYQPPYKTGDWTWDPSRGPWCTTSSNPAFIGGTGVVNNEIKTEE